MVTPFVIWRKWDTTKYFYSYMINMYRAGQIYNGQSGMGVIGIGSPDLKWEKNKAFNLGLDLTFWDRLSLTLDYYTRKTNDLLMNKRISYVPAIMIQ